MSAGQEGRQSDQRTTRFNASLRITDAQRRPVAFSLAAAAMLFVLLAVSNSLRADWLLVVVDAVAFTLLCLYADAIFHSKTNPVSDWILATLILSVLALAMQRLDWIGIVWCPVVMLILHLVARPWVSRTFDVLVVILAATHTLTQHEEANSLRVAAILIITSLIAQLYARNAQRQLTALELQARQLDLVIRCAAVGAMEWTVDRDVAVPSERLAHWLGVPCDPSHPICLIDHVAPDARVELKQQLDVLTSGRMEPYGNRQAAPMDLRFVRSDGQEVWLHAEFLAIANEQGLPLTVVATFIDISRLREAEADTLAALKRQQELSELRARFVAMTSHEFRTPLAAILSSAELLDHYRDRLPESEKQQILRGVFDGVSRMTHMLDRILLINKADANMLEFRPQPTALEPLLLQMAHELEPDPQHRRLRVEMEPPSAQANVDAKLLQHIMGNLMSNALKYSDAGQLVRVTATVTPEQVRLTVADSGIGIAPNDLPDLFEPFHRGSNVGERKGTGLGLTLVKKSVELHGGHIAVESSPGQGTCFDVVLQQGVTP